MLKRIRAGYPQVAVMVLTQYGTIETAVEATRLGAMDYITKPFHVEELRAIELDQENRVLRERFRSRPGFGGRPGRGRRRNPASPRRRSRCAHWCTA